VCHSALPGPVAPTKKSSTSTQVREATDLPSTICCTHRRMPLLPPPPPPWRTEPSRSAYSLIQALEVLPVANPHKPDAQLGKTRTSEYLSRPALVSQLPQQAPPRIRIGTVHHGTHPDTNSTIGATAKPCLCYCAKGTNTRAPSQSTVARPSKTVRWLVASLGQSPSPASASQARARYKGGKRRETSVT
jgi:hypothetical protein